LSRNLVGNSTHSKKIIFSLVNKNFSQGSEIGEFGLAVIGLGAKLRQDMLVNN
jgi:hypothetical protein